MVSIGKIFRVPIILDAHNAGIFPLGGTSNILNELANKINKAAEIVIVSNNGLRYYLEKRSVRAVSIPDPIPEIHSERLRELEKDRLNVVFVCSWANDEPYREVLKAAAQSDNSVRIYITGNSKDKLKRLRGCVPENVTLTGYLSTEEYESLILSCDTVMVLTTRENCLLCGAYEGVAVEKPLILTNTTALKQYFSSGCVFTENSSEGIVQALKRVAEEYEVLSIEIKRLKKRRSEEMATIIDKFKRRLKTLVT